MDEDMNLQIRFASCSNWVNVSSSMIRASNEIKALELCSHTGRREKKKQGE
jgi:hypothetical protein